MRHKVSPNHAPFYWHAHTNPFMGCGLVGNLRGSLGAVGRAVACWSRAHKENDVTLSSHAARGLCMIP